MCIFWYWLVLEKECGHRVSGPSSVKGKSASSFYYALVIMENLIDLPQNIVNKFI